MARFGEKLAAANIEKVDNHAKSMPDKVLIRRHVLEAVNAPVFDAFAGSGEMYRRVWIDAPGYVGCDVRWFPDDPRLAYVSENTRVLRCIDLNEFGIFDLDAYGSPWLQAAIVAARRPVKPGERIGLCLTEGSKMKLKMDEAPRALSVLAGLRPRAVDLASSHDELVDRAIGGLMRRMHCKLIGAWRARGKSAANMLYFGLVLEGLPLAERD